MLQTPRLSQKRHSLRPNLHYVAERTVVDQPDDDLQVRRPLRRYQTEFGQMATQRVN
jgi:hypothetical protein